MCNIINNPAMDSMPGSMYAISIYITISVYIYICVFTRLCVYQFSEKLLTWIPRVSVGRSIFLTQVEVGTVASTAASFPRHLKRKFTGRKIFFDELIGWLSDKWIACA